MSVWPSSFAICCPDNKSQKRTLFSFEPPPLATILFTWEQTNRGGYDIHMQQFSSSQRAPNSVITTSTCKKIIVDGGNSWNIFSLTTDPLQLLLRWKGPKVERCGCRLRSPVAAINRESKLTSPGLHGQSTCHQILIALPASVANQLAISFWSLWIQRKRVMRMLIVALWALSSMPASDLFLASLIPAANDRLPIRRRGYPTFTFVQWPAIVRQSKPSVCECSGIAFGKKIINIWVSFLCK